MAKKKRPKADANTMKRSKPPEATSASQAPQTSIASATHPNPSKSEQKNSKRKQNRMARRRKTPLPSSGSSRTNTNSLIQPYGPKASRKRLIAEGFHKEVSDKTLDQEEWIWSDKAVAVMARPTRAAYIQGNGRFLEGANYINSRRLVQNLKLTSYSLDDLPSRLLGTFAGLEPHGQIMGEMLAMDGMAQFNSVVIAYPKAWAALSSGMAVWNFVAQDFSKQPSGGVFLALNPEYSRYEFDTDAGLGYGRENDKLGKRKIIDAITTIHEKCGGTAPFWGTLERRRALAATPSSDLTWYIEKYDKEIVKMVRSLPHVEGIENIVDRVVGPLTHHPHQVTSQMALSGTFKLLTTINMRKDFLTVLQLDKIPLLDRRATAIVLRSCPQVKMLGIYDCPLLHVGDVICLLDIISEVNRGRGKNEPQIEEFDYYPRFHKGTPYTGSSGQHCATYGITWGPKHNDIVQRGLLAIVMQAVLKSRQMKVGLLMKPNRAFMTWLSNIPTIPAKTYSFLDGLYRYLDLVASKSKDENAVKQATYDMMKAVRMGLEGVRADWPKYYCDEMGTTLLFCSSCGYELLEEFFSMSARYDRPWTRVCTACLLRRWLDEEVDHGKETAKEMLSIFYPDWEPRDFNQDAPLHPDGQGLVRLKTRNVLRAPPPPMQMNAAGQLHQPQFQHELVRDNKIHNDSLQKLPSLSEFLRGDYDEGMHQALLLDLNRTLVLLLNDFYPKANGSLSSFACSRRSADGGFPGHFDEMQPYDSHPGHLNDLSFDFKTAIEAFAYSYECGW
ncbi:hypothetical protein FZEAL_10207 [Fusarium zealandicum]|uniref:Uncharacterized protein n=1 Tax=Fusarium zealandicum TaxID=1053134 RepID=A0A8H4U4J7_9HYPO|nr:hypothetical protein FZEAL_10207 [Fusarium zealandicum]